MKTLKIMFSLHITSREKADFQKRKGWVDISRKSTPLKRWIQTRETAHQYLLFFFLVLDRPWIMDISEGGGLTNLSLVDI